MTGRLLLRVLLLSVAFIIATLLFGWWGVAIVSVIWGVIARGSRGAGILAGVSALAGWAGLLGWSASAGPVGELAATLGGIMGAPGVAFIALSLLFPALLAWAGSRAAAGIAALVTARGS